MTAPRLIFFTAIAFTLAASAADLEETARKLPHVVKPITPPRTDDEFVAAVRTALADPVRHRSLKAIHDLMEYLTPRNARRIEALFGEFSEMGIRLDDGWWAFWVRWGEIDGSGVFAHLLSDPGQKAAGHWHFENAMLGWATVNPAAAEAWLAAHRDAPFYDAIYVALITAYGYTDLNRATAAALALAPQQVGRLHDALGSIAENAYREGGAPGVAEWFEKLNDSAKNIGLIHAHYRINRGDPAFARAWFTAQADKPWRDDKHLSDLASRLIDADPPAAMEWLVELPLFPGSRHPAGVRAGIEHWADKAPTDVTAWLEKHRTASWWPRAAAGYLRVMQKKKDTIAVDAFLRPLDEPTRKAIEAESR
jgi:hypothetical protein